MRRARPVPPRLPALALCAALLLPAASAWAQQVDLSRGGPVEITASDGLEWHQNEQQVVARGNARAVRGNVTVTADQLIAYYRKKASPAGTTTPGAMVPGATAPGATAPAAAAPAAAASPRRRANAGAAAGGPSAPGAGLLNNEDSGGNEIYRVEAIGNVHIFTATDQVWGARAVFDMDQAVLLMTGGNLRLTTPTQVITARDSLEYWTDKRMAVGRGNAVAVTSDAKRIAADTLVAFTKEDNAARRGPSAPNTAPAPPHVRNAQPADSGLAGSGKLQRVEAFGHVTIQTPTEIVTGDRGIYVADTGRARLGGNVHITRGQNQMNGAEAEVDMNTGISRLLSGTAGRVAGLVVPNDPSNQSVTDAAAPANPQTGKPQSGKPTTPREATSRPPRRRPATATPASEAQAPATPAGTGTPQ